MNGRHCAFLKPIQEPIEFTCFINLQKNSGEGEKRKGLIVVTQALVSEAAVGIPVAAYLPKDEGTLPLK